MVLANPGIAKIGIPFYIPEHCTSLKRQQRCRSVFFRRLLFYYVAVYGEKGFEPVRFAQEPKNGTYMQWLRYTIENILFFIKFEPDPEWNLSKNSAVNKCQYLQP